MCTYTFLFTLPLAHLWNLFTQWEDLSTKGQNANGNQDQSNLNYVEIPWKTTRWNICKGTNRMIQNEEMSITTNRVWSICTGASFCLLGSGSVWPAGEDIIQYTYQDKEQNNHWWGRSWTGSAEGGRMQQRSLDLKGFIQFWLAYKHPCLRLQMTTKWEQYLCQTNWLKPRVKKRNSLIISLLSTDSRNCQAVIKDKANEGKMITMSNR